MMVPFSYVFDRKSRYTNSNQATARSNSIQRWGKYADYIIHSGAFKASARSSFAGGSKKETKDPRRKK